VAPNTTSERDQGCQFEELAYQRIDAESTVQRGPGIDQGAKENEGARDEHWAMLEEPIK